MARQIYVMTRGEAELCRRHLSEYIERLGPDEVAKLSPAKLASMAATHTAGTIRSGFTPVVGVTLVSRDTPGWGGYLVDVVRDPAECLVGPQWVEISRSGKYGVLHHVEPVGGGDLTASFEAPGSASSSGKAESGSDGRGELA